MDIHPVGQAGSGSEFRKFVVKKLDVRREKISYLAGMVAALSFLSISIRLASSQSSGVSVFLPCEIATENIQ